MTLDKVFTLNETCVSIILIINQQSLNKWIKRMLTIELLKEICECEWVRERKKLKKERERLIVSNNLKINEYIENLDHLINKWLKIMLNIILTGKWLII